MKTTLFYTGIQVKDLDEALHFFCDICGLEKVGPCSDDLPADYLGTLQKDLLPRLFGLEEKEVRFRSQLVAPVGNHAALYQLYEWVSPKWTQVIEYKPSNHVGIFRSNVIVEGFDDMMRKLEAYEGAEFVAREAMWMSPDPADKEKEPNYARMRLVRHLGSGAVLQMKGDDINSYLDETPGRIKAIRHRAEHVKSAARAVDYFENALGMWRLALDEEGFSHLTTCPNLSERYRHYLCEYQLQRLFGYDPAKYPICDANGTYVGVNGLDGKPQNFDVFEWIVPRACGEAYPTTTHIGFQRLCFIVENFEDVRAKLNAGAATVICDALDMPEITVPGTDIKCTRAMSVFDPDGVFHLILG